MYTRSRHIAVRAARLGGRGLRGLVAYGAVLAIATALSGSTQAVAAASSPQTPTPTGDQTYGDMMSALVSQMESQGARLGQIGTEWTDTSGITTDIIYSSNTATQVQKKRTFDAAGHAQDLQISSKVIASLVTTGSTTGTSGAETGAAAANGSVATSSKLSVHPPQAYFNALTSTDQAVKAKAQQNVGPSQGNVGLLEQLGIVGRAAAAGGGSIVYEPYSTQPTAYGSSQNYGDLTFSWLVWWYNPSGQSGYHSAYLLSLSSWNGNGLLGYPDGGDRDVIDAEFNPSLMYQYGVGWSPDLPYQNGAGKPIVLSCPGGGLNMDSSTGKGWNGAYTQKPSHCSRYAILKVDIRPNSSAAYNVWFNAYFNFTHTWNNNPYNGAISISASYGNLSVSPGFLGGEWNKNFSVRLLI